MGSITNSKIQEYLDRLGFSLERFPYSKNIPVVYVRYIAEVDLYYIGQTGDLRHRYNLACLDQIVYAEVICDPAKRLERERELISEFEEAKLSLASRSVQYDHLRQLMGNARASTVVGKSN